MSQKVDEYKEKIEVFEHSYQEVLAALKHQDEKLNRTLTAIAFLTVAGVALFPKITGSGLAFNDGGPGASAVLFVVFLAAVAIGVIVTLTAIGPGRPLPKRSSEQERSERPVSLLYYARISRDSDWNSKLAQSSQALTEILASNFHEEAKTIAARTDYKIARAREASAWVQLAIVALALMGIFGASELSASARWWIASGLATIVLSIPLWDLRIMREMDYVGRGGFSIPGYSILAASVAFAVSYLVLGDLIGGQWQALAYAGVVFLVPRYAVVRSWAALPLMVLGLVAAVPTLMLMIFLGQ